MIHTPVLVQEVLEHLCHRAEGIYVDGTAGAAGHSREIFKRLSGKGRLICLDRDPEAVRIARQRLASAGSAATVVKANYADTDRVIETLGIASVDGILLDLGMSSYQIEGSGRGFSFSRTEPLDMRMDPEETTTAYHLVNHLAPHELEKILREYGEEKRAGRITRAIVRERAKKPIETSYQLAGIIKSSTRETYRSAAIHPATRTFQALRIAVNKELHNIDTFLSKIPTLISKGGRLVVISYHSLEDRRIKQAMMNWEKGCVCPPDFPKCVCGKPALFRRLSKKGVKPGPEEIEANPRARSAVLRAAERI